MLPCVEVIYLVGGVEYWPGEALLRRTTFPTQNSNIGLVFVVGRLRNAGTKKRAK